MEKSKTTSRRGFLVLATSALTGTAALTLSGTKGLAASEPEVDRNGKYRESQHIKTFYELARF